MALNTLTYPVYAADFDPHNSDFLFVGGGGGETKSGVPNKVSLLDTSGAIGAGGDPAAGELREVAHIDLSRDEDNVNSLAVAHSDDAGAAVFAGINSSLSEQQAGVNEHLRSMKVPYPRLAAAGAGGSDDMVLPRPAALSKASLFTPPKGPKPETYQRVLRLSSPAIKGAKHRLGAIATGLAPEGEIVLFNAATQTPSPTDLVKRIVLGKDEEAGDVDILGTSGSDYRVVYCTDTGLFCLDITLTAKGEGKAKKLLKLFEGSKKEGKFRSLRLLTSNLVLAIRNFPHRKGTQILIYEIRDKPGLAKFRYASALPTSFNAATAMDVVALPATDAAEKRQFLLALAGQNDSIVLFTLDLTPTQSRQIKLAQHSVFRNVHPRGMTALAFSKFAPTPTEVPRKPLRVKLASTSFGSTAAVHTFPLKPRPGPRNATHHVLAQPPQSTFAGIAANIFTGAIVIAIISVIFGAYAELTGKAKLEPLGIRNWAPGPVKDYFGVPRAVGTPIVAAPVVVESMPPMEPGAAARAASRAAAKKQAGAGAGSSAASAASAVDEAMTPVVESLEDIVAQATASILTPVSAIQDILQHVPTEAVAGGEAAREAAEAAKEAGAAAQAKIAGILKDNRDSTGAVVFRDLPHGVGVSTHEHDGHAEQAGARRWEQLSDAQRHLWRRRLAAAGHWAGDETETVLKGVFFGTIAGVVGAAVGG